MAAPSRIKMAVRTVGANILILLLILLCCEVLVRWWRPQLTYSLLLTFLGDFCETGDFIPVKLKSHYRGKLVSQEFRNRIVTCSTNGLGLRGADITVRKPGGTFRILVLGDSYTFGVYVEDDETYPAVLQTSLRERGYRVEVINAGYAGGWGPDTQYAWLEKRGFVFEPDLVIYGFFVGNDVQDIRPQGWRELDARGLPLRIVDDSIYVDSSGIIRSKVQDNKTVGAEFIVPFGEWEKNPRLSGEDFSRPAGPDSGSIRFKRSLAVRLTNPLA